jgi:tRNA 5-methylaminomethyl-2-thiouridine biosynthesis bifunctional protein
MKIIVIGAGLAGAATAHALATHGCEVTVLEAHGASDSTAPSISLPVALMAPHNSLDDNTPSPLTQLSRLGVAATTQAARALLVDGQDWSSCGALQRPGKLGPQARWSAQAAWVKPAALVAAWLAHPRITLRTGAQVHSLQRVPSRSVVNAPWQALAADGSPWAQGHAIVLANAHAAQSLLNCLGANPRIANALHQVAGQVIYGPWTDQWQTLWPQLLPELRQHTAQPTPCAINGNGHFIPAIPWHNGPIWLSGSTYEHDVASPQVTTQGISANMQRLQQLIPGAAQLLTQQHHSGQLQAWAGSRCTTRDRLPLAGTVGVPGIYACTAMGSRGLSFAALCGQHVAALITGAQDSALPVHLRQAISSLRFF